MEIVGVQGEGQARQGGHAEDAVPAVKLRQLRTQQRVLHRGEDAVAQPLVERHPPFARLPLLQHAAAEHQVGLALHQRIEQTGQLLRGVLPIPVHHGDVVEAFFDRIAVPDLLVSPVALVVLVA